eukprot:CAMPEP_0113564756 /NCGR_PEP_ID=MMETSP0015_2-20120614/21797_1 /TAXON_ID=2838 /ORGANISM="Odontella" /LENGTH=510 /DNA_ID=CAMNT_0000466875 /DNA_START=194 /DNA_END=1726 /DNA_ORIENTATION=+ /assembly_acc=CAM_ASM_000160
MKVDESLDAVRHTKNAEATLPVRHRTARKSSQPQLARSLVGNAKHPGGEVGSENTKQFFPQQTTTTRTLDTAIVKTVQSKCPKMDFTAAITGQGSLQGTNSAKSEILAEFSYIVELSKSYENQMSNGRFYDIISTMEKMMHRTLAESMLDCSVGGLRRRQRQLQFGLEDNVGKLRVVGVNSAPLDQVSSSVACIPTEKSRQCMGMAGAITLTYVWEGDIKDEDGMRQQIESTRYHAVDAIKISMENGDYVDQSLMAPIKRVSFSAAPSIPGLKGPGLPFSPRSVRDSNRIRSIVITAGVLLLAAVFILMWLNGRIKRKRVKGGEVEDTKPSADCSTDASTPQKMAEQPSMMFVDSIQEVWRKSWDLSCSNIEPCRSQDNSDFVLRSNFSDDAVATSPTHGDTGDEFGWLEISKSDSFVTRKSGHKKPELINKRLAASKSYSSATKFSNNYSQFQEAISSRKDKDEDNDITAELLINKNSNNAKDFGDSQAKPICDDHNCFTQHITNCGFE